MIWICNTSQSKVTNLVFKKLKRKKHIRHTASNTTTLLIHLSPTHDVTPTNTGMVTCIFRNKLLHNGYEKSFGLSTKSIQLGHARTRKNKQFGKKRCSWCTSYVPLWAYLTPSLPNRWEDIPLQPVIRNLPENKKRRRLRFPENKTTDQQLCSKAQYPFLHKLPL